jgi:hypothetical protein
MMQAVILLELPTGQSTKDSPLTVGKTYELLHRNGSNVCITTDDPLLTATIWQGRVKILKDDDTTTLVLTAREVSEVFQRARDLLFLHPETAGDPNVAKALMLRYDQITESLWYGDLLKVTPMPINDRKKRPAVPVLSMKDVRAAAKAKGAKVVGTGGDYNVEAPKGFKWDGDLHSFLLTFNPKDHNDTQHAINDVIERINGSALEPYDGSEE